MGSPTIGFKLQAVHGSRNYSASIKLALCYNFHLDICKGHLIASNRNCIGCARKRKSKLTGSVCRFRELLVANDEAVVGKTAASSGGNKTPDVRAPSAPFGDLCFFVLGYRLILFLFVITFPRRQKVLNYST